MPVHVGGRKVYLKQGRTTQTVNICDQVNQWGQYDETYVVRGSQDFVDMEQVAAFNTVQDLENWLGTRGATLRRREDFPHDSIDSVSGVAKAANAP
jgi:citrate lyase beta subunit